MIDSAITRPWFSFLIIILLRTGERWSQGGLVWKCDGTIKVDLLLKASRSTEKHFVGKTPLKGTTATYIQCEHQWNSSSIKERTKQHKVEGERSIKLHKSFIYICCSMRSEMCVPILWRSGTYNAQKADNRIISLLHPPAAIPKILFDISPTFLSTQSKNKCEEYLRTPRLWSRIGENLEVFVSTQHLQETKFEDICHIQIPLYLPLISSNVIELQYITQQ